MTNSTQYKCPNCDGPLSFDPNSQKLHCEHCGGEFEIDTFNEGKEFTIDNDIWNQEELNVFSCNNCGGAVMVNKTTASTNCPYCGNPMVLHGNIEGDYKPSRIIPFKLDKEAAKQQYLKHISNKLLLPSSFKSQGIVEQIKGLYVPFWLFDGKGNAQIWYNAQKTRHWSDDEYDYTETSFYKLFRAGNVSFVKVPVDASNKIDDDLSQSIEPFENNELTNFNKNYLVGYVADKYDVEANKAKETANERIANSTTNLLYGTTGGFEKVVPISSRLNITEGKQEYVMLPMWIMNIDYQGKKYTFAMNGQTGKFVGNLPVDKKKMILLIIISFIVTTAIALLVQYLMYGDLL